MSKLRDYLNELEVELYGKARQENTSLHAFGKALNSMFHREEETPVQENVVETETEYEDYKNEPEITININISFGMSDEIYEKELARQRELDRHWYNFGKAD